MRSKHEQHELCVTLGRWTGPDQFTVEDMDAATLLDVVKRKIKQYMTPQDESGMGQALKMSTQVLIWDAAWNRCHNLIAIYDIRGGKLTML